MIGSLDDPMQLTFGSGEVSVMADVYPNPFKDNISLDFYLNSNQKVQIKLYNGIGTEIALAQIELSKGKYELDLLETLNLDKSISDGVYMLKIEYNGKEELIKIVKQ